MSFRHDDVLLVVDVQNDFCAGGALAVPDGNAVVDVANALMGRAPLVVLTQDWHPPDHRSFASAHPGRKPLDVVDMPYGRQVLWPDHCVQGTRGAEFHPRLDTTAAAVIVRKGTDRDVDSYSALFENDRATPTGLAGYLRERGVRRVVLVGLATDFCVLYSALDAVKEGFAAALVEDGCRGIDAHGSLRRAFEQLEAIGVQRLGAAELDRP